MFRRLRGAAAVLWVDHLFKRCLLLQTCSDTAQICGWYYYGKASRCDSGASDLVRSAKSNYYEHHHHEYYYDEYYHDHDAYHNYNYYYDADDNHYYDDPEPDYHYKHYYHHDEQQF